MSSALQDASHKKRSFSFEETQRETGHTAGATRLELARIHPILE
jgi:hypothetical protein